MEKNFLFQCNIGEIEYQAEKGFAGPDAVGGGQSKSCFMTEVQLWV